MRKPIVANLCLLSAAVVFALALGQDTARSRAGILFEFHFVEGLCPGNCRTETLIRKDGTLTSTHYALDESTATETSPGVISVSWRGEVLGTATVDRADVAALTAQIEGADFALIRSKSPSGSCPTALDIPKAVYVFHTSKGPEVIDSCDVKIDPASPLFRTVEEVLSKYPGR